MCVYVTDTLSMQGMLHWMFSDTRHGGRWVADLGMRRSHVVIFEWVTPGEVKKKEEGKIDMTSDAWTRRRRRYNCAVALSRKVGS